MNNTNKLSQNNFRYFKYQLSIFIYPPDQVCLKKKNSGKENIQYMQFLTHKHFSLFIQKLNPIRLSFKKHKVIQFMFLKTNISLK